MPLYTPLPGQVDQQAQSPLKFRNSHQTLSGTPSRPIRVEREAGSEVPDKGGSRVWIWDADPPSLLNPPHPQSLGTGRAP